MADIESLAEGQAFMDAADDILGLNHAFSDAEIARLRRAWIAGRDWTRRQVGEALATQIDFDGDDEWGQDTAQEALERGPR